MKFYILGGTGFLGGGFVEYLKKNGQEVVADKLDITDYPKLLETFQREKPDVVVNFAGVRAQPHIDWCEDHKSETTHVNLAGVVNAMIAALNSGAYPIQLSSGCVYNGGTDYEFTEEDAPNFFDSYYSRMRVAEQIALKELPVLVARIRMPISMVPHPRNFTTKIAGYKQVINIPNSMTLIEDLWPALLKLSELRPTGILNLTNEGWADHGSVLSAYKEIVDPNHTYEPISLEQLVGPGGITKSGRSNCVLSNKKATDMGLSFPRLDQDRLREIMKIYKASL